MEKMSITTYNNIYMRLLIKRICLYNIILNLKHSVNGIGMRYSIKTPLNLVRFNDFHT